MMYDVCIMRRTNIYLPDDRLATLRRLGEQRGVPVAALVREAVDSWLESQGVQVIGEDEWQLRFRALLTRRRKEARSLDVSTEEVENEVERALQEVRRLRARTGPARRR